MTKNPTTNQQEAIEHFEGPLLIIAGPGAGKTQVLIERVRYLVEERGVDPKKILLTTFTLKAAEELKAKIIEKIGKNAEPINVSNIHSFCHKILEKYSGYHQLGANFDVLDEGMQRMFLRNHLDDLDIKEDNFDALISFFGKCSENCISPDRLIERVTEVYPKRSNFLRMCRSYKRYLVLLEENKKIDFAGLQRSVFELLKKDPDVLEDIRSKIDFILVDEYQDTNPIQDKIFELITNPKNNICVVGDDDQSIYGFRGATVENFVNFSEKYPNTKIVRLDTNFRSTSNIIDISEEFMSNYRILKKDIKPYRGQGNNVILLKNDSDEDEAEKIIEVITEMKKNQIIPHYGCVTLLFSSVKHEAKKIIEKLNDEKLPYTVKEDPVFLKREEIRVMLYLMYYVDPNKSYEGRLRRRWGRWWNKTLLETEFLDLSSETIKVLIQLLNTVDINSISPEEFVKSGITDKNDIEKLSRLYKLKTTLKDNNHEVLEVFYEILEITGYLKRLLNDETDINRSKIFYLARMTSIINKYAHISEKTSIGDFLQFLHNSPRKLYYDEYMLEDPYSIKIMTIHQAKGLEFPVVFICNVKKRNFKINPPQRERYPIPEDLLMNRQKHSENEEGRKFYVAMTRAQDTLIISGIKEINRDIIQYSPFITQDITKNKFSGPNAIQIPCKVRETIKKDQNITYSSILTYETCPALFKMKYYYLFETKLSLRQKYGTILHKCLNNIHIAISNHEPITSETINIIVNTCWVNISKSPSDNEKIKEVLIERLWEYYQTNKDNIKQVISSEESFSVYTNNILISGRIDLIMENSRGELELVDFKVSGIKDWQLKEVEKQLKVYKYALNDEYSFDQISAYHISENKKTYFESKEEDMEKIESYLGSICENITNEEFNPEKSNFCKICEFNFCCALNGAPN